MKPALCLSFLVMFDAQAVGAGEARPTLTELWANLASTDDACVARAVLQLGAARDEAIGMLNERLRPVKAEPARVARLIADLGSEKFAVRESASAELEYYGKYVKSDLQKALADKAGAEPAKRLKALLNKIPDPDAKPKAPPTLPDPRKGIRLMTFNGKVLINGIPLESYMTPPALVVTSSPSSWARAARAIAVLEHIGTPQARDLLGRMATGETDALPTIEARAALERLKKRGG